MTVSTEAARASAPAPASALTTATPRTATPTHTAALAHLGHALSDATRSAILLSLRGGAKCPADLAAEQGVSRQSMSNHLTTLRSCGLVVAEKSGRHAHYSLAHTDVAAALDAMLGLALALDPDCCSGQECTC
ncbi:ArsR/SmtB family transcription factor [Demequina muriae]|uniref:Metalloregulator ArsR/SmtB family transcription factor n=1 Tax=Demequina muriae TaxID=3051664 RepID=A0ABT8GDI1_9MICO|nr:metalloregulator ArsR/SmtB family transcription factor [Demequina sp. EGI L300058]MDN4479486.1 metalloregulator ArsR/SmtB family transcription factor [Demequina sp. EGI L300058]